MKVEFKKSFERDLSKIKDPGLLRKIQAVIEEIDTSHSYFPRAIAPPLMLEKDPKVPLNGSVFRKLNHQEPWDLVISES